MLHLSKIISPKIHEIGLLKGQIVEPKSGGVAKGSRGMTLSKPRLRNKLPKVVAITIQKDTNFLKLSLLFRFNESESFFECL